MLHHEVKKLLVLELLQSWYNTARTIQREHVVHLLANIAKKYNMYEQDLEQRETPDI